MIRIHRKHLVPCLVLMLAPAAAHGKIVFTGYGDFQATEQALFNIEGPAAPLSALGIAPESIEARGANINSLGIFATTDISDNATMQMDLTYRNIGATTKTIDVQYAYLQGSLYDTQLEAGKITLPFGYYNQNRFYPFERPSISGPIFQSTILGLPMADIGAGAEKTIALGDASLKADLYAVNGFGPTPGSTATFRAPTLPSGISITNNISGQDLNHRIAWGMRLELSPQDFSNDAVGASYYRDQWNPSGSGLFQMTGAHLHFVHAGFDFLTEYLFMDVTNDYGMLNNLGSLHWMTSGFFSELEYKNLSLWQKPVIPWIRTENYHSHGGSPGYEGLWAYSGGFAVDILPQLTAKFEADYLYYQLPFQHEGTISLRGYTLTSDLVVTF